MRSLLTPALPLGAPVPLGVADQPEFACLLARARENLNVDFGPKEGFIFLLVPIVSVCCCSCRLPARCKGWREKALLSC